MGTVMEATLAAVGGGGGGGGGSDDSRRSISDHPMPKSKYF